MKDNKVESLLTEISQKIGFKNCALFFKESQNITLHWTYQENWKNQYLKNQYYADDYVLLKKKNDQKPIIWGVSQLKKCNEKQKNIFIEAADYKIISGITLPFLVSKTSIKTATFASNLDEKHLKMRLNEIKEKVFSVAGILMTSFSFCPNIENLSNDDLNMLQKFLHHQANEQEKNEKKRRALQKTLYTAQCEASNYAHPILRDRLALLLDLATHHLKKKDFF